MNHRTLIELSRKLRERYGLCLEALKAAEAAFDSQGYDEVFWGAPDAWEEVTDARQLTIANLLYKPGPPGATEEPATYTYPRVCASFLDGCYTVHGHAGEFADWVTLEHLLPYQEKHYRRGQRGYASNMPEAARWILVGARKSQGHAPMRCAGTPRYEPRTPCMDGVSLHVDLTWDALVLHISGADNELCRLVLPQWGVKARLHALGNSDIASPENEPRIKHMLVKNQVIQLPGKDCPLQVRPQDLRMAPYVNRLCHLLPYAPESELRLTGWFTGALLRAEAEAWLSPRYRKLVFGYPYDTWRYE